MVGPRIFGTFAVLAVAGCGTGSTTGVAEASPDTGIMIDRRPMGPESHLGAHQVVVDYYALLAKRRYDDAWKLWADAGRATGKTPAEFAEGFADVARYEPKVGGIGAMQREGDRFTITVYVEVNGEHTDGAPIHQQGWVSLSRPKDVGDAPSGQPVWHITGVPG
ncbi:hypothetical protein [Sphingomonas fennica]|uniref:Lipoprotein n=1 Tax=Edaphosphingomonas fennica TaxID=114404 RepID=A0A2T4I063_9SPHN|nr:hypothetical protein [Sphingomonas fennica]PTD22092.1 hypothetical protein CV103_09990 [Sphingomonas fennica]